MKPPACKRIRPRRADSSDDDREDDHAIAPVVAPPPSTQPPQHTRPLALPSTQPPLPLSRPSSPEIEEISSSAVKAAETDKRKAFDIRWKTAERTPDQVLGEYLYPFTRFPPILTYRRLLYIMR